MNSGREFIDAALHLSPLYLSNGQHRKPKSRGVVRRDDFAAVEHFRIDDDFKSLFERAVAPHFVLVPDDDIDSLFALRGG